MTDLLTACPWFFLIPLLAGFAFNSASAFTAAYSRRWGAPAGRLITAVLRNVLGIPVWVAGLVVAARTPAPALLPAGPPDGVRGLSPDRPGLRRGHLVTGDPAVEGRRAVRRRRAG